MTFLMTIIMLYISLIDTESINVSCYASKADITQTYVHVHSIYIPGLKPGKVTRVKWVTICAGRPGL